jgi:membrane protein DedA with SNARE-associated domain
MLAHWIAQYGYWAILFGTFFEGETIVVLAGYAAHRGYLSAPIVAGAAFAGSLAGDQFAYLLGHNFQSTLLSRRKSWLRRMTQIKTWFDRHSILVMLGFRFVYGIRTITPFALGTMKVPARIFAPLNALGALVWAPLFTWLGYAFGQVASLVLARAHEYEHFVMVAIAIAGAAAAIAHAIRQRVRERRNGVSSTPDDGK